MIQRRRLRSVGRRKTLCCRTSVRARRNNWRQCDALLLDLDAAGQLLGENIRLICRLRVNSRFVKGTLHTY